MKRQPLPKGGSTLTKNTAQPKGGSKLFATSVSKLEKKKIKKLYYKNTVLYPNAININNKVKKIKRKKKYLIYSGSYLYKPNKEAIDYLNYKIMDKNYFYETARTGPRPQSI